MKKFFHTLVLLFLLSFEIMGQSVGDWRLHINYSNANYGAISNQRILVANDKSVLEYNFDDNSLITYDKAKGLSDHGTSALSYDELTNTFILAYSNSNIDLIKGNTIINLPDIKNKLSAGSKNINAIMCSQGFAYLSTDFGIVVVDLENEEVDNTYIIGNTGNAVEIFDCAIVKDTIYALSAEGLKSAYLYDVNLLDYSNWENALVGSNFSEIESFRDTLFALGAGLFKLEGSTWNNIYPTDPNDINHLYSSEDLTFVINKLLVLKYLGNIDTLSTPFLIDPSFCIKSKNVYYYGDFKFGLFENNSRISTISSPFTNKGFRACAFENQIAITSGGFDKNLDGFLNGEGGFYIFNKNNWINHNIYSTLANNEISMDLNNLAYNEIDKKLYIANFEGLIEFDFNTAKIYNSSNSPIETVLSRSKLIAVDVDSEGNVWVINPQSSAALLVKKLDGTWQEFVLGNDNEKFNGLYIDNTDQKWITQRDEGIIVFKEGPNLSASGSQLIALSTNSQRGNLPNNNVNRIIQDKDGQVWVGTDQGIAVFSCPESILDDASCEISDRITNTLDEYTEYLFETDAVKVIEVDGANRKWIGTSAGVWLLSEDGKTEILSFNLENSPLPSNDINDIKVNKATGEVFILTEQGIVSYFSDATEGAENHDNIKAYPNPVRPEYTGFISITGLVENAFVKITDANGILIEEGYALGGKYVWSGNDYNGIRAKTGVYYVFSSDSDAQEKAVTKIAFVR